MGWFDNDGKEETGAAPSARQAPARPAAAPARATGGSTLGERVHVNGTISCEEDLTILGRVEGQIQARAKLLIAKQAQVQALVKGTKVMVEGTINGDVHAADALVLGASASLTGNIKTPSLQIRDGAYFKGSIEMEPQTVDKPASARGEQRPQAAKAPATSDAARRPKAAAAETAAAETAGNAPASAG